MPQQHVHSVQIPRTVRIGPTEIVTHHYVPLLNCSMSTCIHQRAAPLHSIYIILLFLGHLLCGHLSLQARWGGGGMLAIVSAGVLLVIMLINHTSICNAEYVFKMILVPTAMG